MIDKLTILLFCLAVIGVQSCGSDSGSPTSPGDSDEQLSLSIKIDGSKASSNLNIPATASDIVFTVEAIADEWKYTISEGTAWLTEKKQKATSLILHAAKNTGKKRTATITFQLLNHPSVKKVIRVTQAKKKMVVYVSFENPDKEPKLNARYNAMDYKIVNNPDKSGINTSDKVGRITKTTHKWDFIWSEPLSGTFNLSQSQVFKVKVYSAVPGRVYLKLTNSAGYDLGHVQVGQILTATNEWTELTFDFSSTDYKKIPFDKFTLLFKGRKHPGNDWYFDDISGPPLK